jgi:hypothetical protein
MSDDDLDAIERIVLERQRRYGGSLEDNARAVLDESILMCLEEGVEPASWGDELGRRAGALDETEAET